LRARIELDRGVEEIERQWTEFLDAVEKDRSINVLES
jgi:hypothetical protein